MNRKDSLFICFVGIDGSGKTTQARALLDTLGEWGVESRYVWSRFEPKLIKPFVAVAKRLYFQGKDVYADYAEYVGTKRKLARNPLLHSVYEYLLLCDYYVQTVVRIQHFLVKGVTVVCDRYVYDTVADLATDFGYSSELARHKLRNYLRVFPKPDIVFLIDLPEEIAYRRKDDVPSLDYLRDRRRVYSLLEQAPNIVHLDGRMDVTELRQVVQLRVKQALHHSPIVL